MNDKNMVNSVSSSIKKSFDEYCEQSNKIRENLFFVLNDLKRKGDANLIQSVDLSLSAIQKLDDKFREEINKQVSMASELDVAKEKIDTLNDEINRLVLANDRGQKLALDVQQNLSVAKRILSVLLTQEFFNQCARFVFTVSSVTFVFWILHNIYTMIRENVGYPSGEYLDVNWAWISYILKISGSTALVIVIFVTLARFISNCSSRVSEVNSLLKSLSVSKDNLLEINNQNKNESQ